MRAACFVLVVCLVAGCEDKPAGKGGGATTPPKAGAPGKFKNATELGAYLNSKGIKGTINPGGLFDKPERPCSAFWGEKHHDAAMLIYLCKSEDEAEQLAGASGDKGFRSGRFCIVNHGSGKENDELFAATKKLLR